MTRILASLALAAGLLVAAPTSAQADTAHCVTKREKDRLHVGMVRGRVHEVVDTHGRYDSERRGTVTRRYRYCVAEPDLYMFVVYSKATHRVRYIIAGH